MEVFNSKRPSLKAPLTEEERKLIIEEMELMAYAQARIQAKCMAVGLKKMEDGFVRRGVII